jgi:hypothetical protein
VPQDLPCEQCATRDFNKPNPIVPQISDDEPLPQFIWKGINYLEKMWIDSSFLQDNLLIKKTVPDLDTKFNPLFLFRDAYRSNLDSLVEGSNDPLTFLKGKMEQIREAEVAGTRSRQYLQGNELMGVAYAPENATGLLNLDKAADKITNNALKNKYSNLNDSLNMSKANMDEIMKDNLIGGDGNNGLKPTNKLNQRPGTSPIFSQWNTLSPLDAVNSSLLSSSFSGNVFDRPYSVNFRSWLNIEDEDKIALGRLQRALSILGNSTSLTKHDLHYSVVPESVAASSLIRRPLRKVDKSQSAGSSRNNNNFNNDDDNDEHGNNTNIENKSDRTVYTKASYSFRGAKFITGQMRVPVANRVDDIWCVTKKGEFAGLTKGRNMRSFEFKDNLLMEGRARVKERQILRDNMMVSIDIDYVNADILLIKKLLKDAYKIPKGTILDLTKIQVENFLKHRLLTIKTCIKMQSMFHGNVDRKRVKKMRYNIKIKKLRAKLTREQSATTARALIPPLTQKVLMDQIPLQSKPSFWVQSNMSGIQAVITVYTSCRYVKRSLNQCISCRTKSIVRKYDPLTDTYFNDRSPCTCPMVKSAEKWLLHVFDPLSRITLKKEYTIDEVRKHIQTITCAAKLMDPESRSKSLLGKSFGKLNGLFVALGELNFSGALDKSHSMASLRASEESSVLPLLPKLLSPDLLHSIDTREDLPVDKLQKYNYNAQVPSITSNIDELDRSVVPSWTWEPMTDIKYAERQDDKVRHWISVLENHDKEACLHRDICVVDAETYLTNNVEWANMSFEDARVRFIETDELIFAAEKRIKEVMIFSLKGLDKVKLEEKGLAEDWDQGYDNLEDGSAWQGLNNKRKLIKLHAEYIIIYKERWLELKEVEKINLAKIQCEKESLENVTFHKKELETYRPNIEFVRNIRKSIFTLAGASANALAATLTMPRKFRNAVRRIQHVNYKLVFIRDALERARKEYRGAWTFLDRRIMALRPVQNIGGNAKNVLRCCVEIFFDSTTGYYIMHVGQDEMPMEESTQHEDFKLIKSDFSDLTFHGLANDIILRPLDVKAMLSKSPSWPAEHLEKPPVRFKHASLKLKTAKLAASSLLNKPQIEIKIPTEIILTEDNTLRVQTPTKTSVPVTPSKTNKKIDKKVSIINNNKKDEKPRTTISRSRSKTIISPKPRVRSAKKEIIDVEIVEEAKKDEDVVKVVEDIVEIDPNAFVIPSLRPRALTGVKKWKSQLDRSTTLPATYNLRRKKGEKEECSTAAALFNYLRLQPHTGRPCLGLVHFRRRIEYTSKYLYQCLWYKDLAKESPTIQSNLITNRIYTICRRSIIATIFFCMKRFQINIHANGKDLGMVVHTDEVIIRMSSKPILLAAFLCELISNRFSLETIEFLFENIYLQLPGEKDCGGQWRGSFRHEIPRIYFLPDVKTRFRGPIYCTHRFLSGRYFRIMFFMNANDDFKITLTAPIDSNFWCHMYCGKDIIFEISRNEARAFIAKACVNNELVKNKFMGNLDILHPMNWNHFFMLIIDTIFLAPGVAFTKEMIGNEDSIETSLDIDENEDEDVKKDISSLSIKISRVASKYEAWSLRSKYKLRPKLHTTDSEKISTAFEHVPPSLWTLQLRKDGLSNKLVEVQSGVWGTHDLDKFYGEKLSDHYKKRIELMKKHNYYGSSSETLESKKVLSPFNGIVGFNHLSYWNVRILTDEPKKCFYLNLKPSKITNNSVQAYLAENEMILMFEEDKRSLQYQVTDKNIAIQSKLANQLSSLEKELKSILPSFTTKSNKNNKGINILNDLRTKVLLKADEMFLKHLSKTNNQMNKIISFNENENPELIIKQPNSISVNDISNDMMMNKNSSKELLPIKKVVHVIKPSKDVKKPIRDIIFWMESIISSLESNNKQFTDKLDILLLKTVDPRSIQNYSSRVRQQGMVNFTSNDFPRHCLYTTVSLNENDYNNKFRDCNSWSRNNYFQISTHKGSNQIFNKNNHVHKIENSSIKTVNGRIVMISSPTNGPFDSVGIKVYNPSQRKGWNLVCCPNNPLPLLWPQKVYNEIELVNDNKDEDINNFIYNSTHSSLTKFCAERIVWNVLLHGTTKAVIQAVTEKLHLTTVDMKNKIADVFDEIKKVTSLLEISKNKTNDIQNNDYEIDDSCYNNFFESDKKRIIENSNNNNYTELIKSIPNINKLDSDDKLSTKFDGSHLAIIENPEPFRYFSLLGNVKLYGVFIPSDEANSSLPIETDSISLMHVISYFLGNNFKRNHSLPSIVYTNCEIGLETELLNPRANRWITEYKKNLGWKKDLDFTKMQHTLKTDLKNYNFCKPDICGDIVLFLRNIEDVSLLKQWLSDRYEDYRPIRDARRLRARKEREWRVEKHAYFRRCVFKMASRFRYGSEKMFDYRTHSDAINKNYNESFDLPPYLLRVLFTQFLDMRKFIDNSNDNTIDEKISSINILDEAFLLDTDVAHVTEEALQRFEELPEPEVFTNVTSVLNCKATKLKKSNQIIYNRHDLQPRVGQLVYALYQLHCFECTRSTNLCKFPGCPFIRNHAETIMKDGIDENPNPEINSKEVVTKSIKVNPTIVNDEYVSSDDHPTYSDQITINNKLCLSDQYKSLLGSGHHPMEISIKLYLITSQDFLHRLGASYNVPSGLDVDDEISMEAEIDRLEIKRVKDLEDLRIHWRDIEEEGRQLRYIHRRWVQQELSNVISGDDILAAKGGEEIINDEGLLSSTLIEDSNKISNSSGYKKILAQDKENNLISNIENEDEEIETNKTKENSNDKNLEMLVCLPKTLIIQMLGGVSGCDGKNWLVPYDDIDPYPQINDKERERRFAMEKSSKSKRIKPMSQKLYEWMMSKLYITRPIRLTTPVSGDRGQSLTKKVDVKFDRLHCECVVYLNDGSLVTILIFHGIINNVTLCHDDISGVPPGAIRYCPIDLVPQLEAGLTIAVYDTKSYKTVCIAIEMAKIFRIAETFKLSPTDFPRISQKILEYSNMVIRLSRVGIICTAASLDLNYISIIKGLQSKRLREHLDIGNQQNRYGRRHIVSDRRGSRLASAKKYLTKQ